MPIIKSAKKRVRVSAKATIRNNRTKRDMKEAIKTFQAALSKKGTKLEEAHRRAVSAIDVAAKKNVIHKNKAARKKSQLHEALKQANVKLKTTKKVVTKKSVTKKTSAKKPVAKKSPAKSPTKKS